MKCQIVCLWVPILPFGKLEDVRKCTSVGASTAMQAKPVWLPVQVPGAPLMIQLRANAAGETVEDGLEPWVLAPTRETWKTPMAPSFVLAQPRSL